MIDLTTKEGRNEAVNSLLAYKNWCDKHSDIISSRVVVKTLDGFDDHGNVCVLGCVVYFVDDEQIKYCISENGIEYITTKICHSDFVTALSNYDLFGNTEDLNVDIDIDENGNSQILVGVIRVEDINRLNKAVNSIINERKN